MTKAEEMKQMWSQLMLLFVIITAGIAVAMPQRWRPRPASDDRDRGAVSLEQVLWFVAAGLAVAVIAGIVWAKIKDQANTDPAVPHAP
jgi:hypothetical protein